MGWSDKWSEDWKSLSQDSQTSTRKGQLGEALRLCGGLSREHRARWSPCSSKTLPFLLPLTHPPCSITQRDSEPTESMVPTLVYSFPLSFYSTISMMKREKFLFQDRLHKAKDTLHFCLEQKVQRNKRMKKSPKLPNNKQMKKQEPIFFKSNDGRGGNKPSLRKSLYRISEEHGCQSRLPSQTVNGWGWRRGLSLTSAVPVRWWHHRPSGSSRISLKRFFCCWCCWSLSSWVWLNPCLHICCQASSPHWLKWRLFLQPTTLATICTADNFWHFYLWNSCLLASPSLKEPPSSDCSVPGRSQQCPITLLLLEAMLHQPQEELLHSTPCAEPHYSSSHGSCSGGLLSSSIYFP